jgi:hypothetical protein
MNNNWEAVDDAIKNLLKLVASGSDDDKEYISDLKMTQKLFNASVEMIINETTTNKGLN